MGAKEIAAKQYSVLVQIRDHRLGPVYPRRLDELQCLAAKWQPLAVLHSHHSFRLDMQKRRQQILAPLRRDHGGRWKPLQDGYEGGRMVLFGMVGADVVQLPD